MMDIDKIKQRILDLAIRGKLVSQDPNDKPASVLIEKIKAEKEKMIKEGKIKPSKDDSYIYKASDNCYYEKKGNTVKNVTSEIPFDIPENWIWIRLGDLGFFKKGPFGSSLTKSMFVPETTKNRIKVYEQKNVIQKNDKLGHYFISFEKYECMKSFSVSPEEIIVSCAGTIGEIYQLPKNAEIGIINQALMKIHLYYLPLSTYFILYFDFVLKTQTSEKGKGTCIKNIPPLSVLKEMLVPLPPEGEILRILDKIKMICTYTDLITKEEQSIKTLSNAVKTKILDYFFGDNSSYKSYYEKKKIEDISKTISVSDFEIKIKYILPNGIIPVVSQSMNLIDGYINESEKILSNIPYIVFGDHTKVVKFINFPFVPGADGTKILKPIEGIEPKFLFYSSLYASNKIESRGYGRHYSKFRKVYIPVYPINLQQNIVTILDKVFSLIDSNIINKFYL